MKILWICSGVLSDFSEEFNVKKRYVGSWQTGLLTQLKNKTNLEFGLCFPIIDKSRRRDGTAHSHRYYSFNCNLFNIENIDEIGEMTDRFREIISDFLPDVIHIWGSELPHSYAAAQACEELGIINKVIVDIQGLYSTLGTHFYADIPSQYRVGALKQAKDLIDAYGIYEQRLLKKKCSVFGRTDWDKACVAMINDTLAYFHADRVLRHGFYENAGNWNIDRCEPYSIFISQGYDPFKGLHYLLQAMPTILKSLPSAHIYVAGHDHVFTEVSDDNRATHSYGRYIKDLCEELHLKDNITFLGSLSEKEMVAQYLKTHVVVSASSCENSSNSVSEAMLLGVPVVSSMAGGITSLMVNKRDGYIYQHNAPYMLAYYILQIFGDRKIAKEFSESASQSMSKIVNITKNTSRIAEVYAIIGGSSESSRSVI